MWLWVLFKEWDGREGWIKRKERNPGPQTSDSVWLIRQGGTQGFLSLGNITTASPSFRMHLHTPSQHFQMIPRKTHSQWHIQSGYLSTISGLQSPRGISCIQAGATPAAKELLPRKLVPSVLLPLLETLPVNDIYSALGFVPASGSLPLTLD